MLVLQFLCEAALSPGTRCEISPSHERTPQAGGVLTPARPGSGGHARPQGCSSPPPKTKCLPTESTRMLFMHGAAQLSPTFLTADHQQSWANNLARIIYSTNFDSLPTSCSCFSQRSYEIIQRNCCLGLQLVQPADSKCLTPPALPCCPLGLLQFGASIISYLFCS